MNATELATLSMSELKSTCASHAIEVTGDKRSKSTYILAIETFQSEQTVIEIIEMPAIPNPFELPLVEDVTACSHSPMADSIVKGAGYANEIPVPQPTTPTPQRQASIVALVAILLFGTAFLVVKIGFTSLMWVIASLAPVLAGMWRYLVPDSIDTNSIPIDYFPTPHPISA